MMEGAAKHGTINLSLNRYLTVKREAEGKLDIVIAKLAWKAEIERAAERAAAMFQANPEMLTIDIMVDGRVAGTINRLGDAELPS